MKQTVAPMVLDNIQRDNQQRIFAGIKKRTPPQPIEKPEEIREGLAKKIQAFREQLQRGCEQRLGSGEIRIAVKPNPITNRTVNESIIDKVLAENPQKSGPEWEKLSRGELAEHLKRFDWRELAVVPPVRDQRIINRPGVANSCWAHVATEVFESSLMIQRSNFATNTLNHRPDSRFWIEQIALNVHSTFNRAPSDSGGRLEEGFNHYFNVGIPREEVSLNGLPLGGGNQPPATEPKAEERDPQLTERPIAKVVKIIGWDYVHQPPFEIPPVSELKAALLEHGPLAVSMLSNGKFEKYGRLSLKMRGNGALAGKNSITRARFEKDRAGNLFVRFPTKLLPQDQAGRPTLEVLQTNELSMQFLAATAPVLKIGAHHRLTEADQPVELIFDTKNVLLKFPASNAIKLEDDPDKGGVNLVFPANTDARFSLDQTTDLLTACFPWAPPAPPIFHADTSPFVNHVVLLVGWDDDKCAWIIQNTFGEDWGIECDFKGGFPIGAGYAYIGYDTIGHYAAWVEAELIDEGFVEDVLKAPQLVLYPAQSLG
jgi:hypothetical protein